METKISTTQMALYIIAGAENTKQLIDAAKSLRSAAKVAAYREDDCTRNLEKLVTAIEIRHEEILPDPMKSDVVDGKLVDILRELHTFIG